MASGRITAVDLYWKVTMLEVLRLTVGKGYNFGVLGCDGMYSHAPHNDVSVNDGPHI